MKKKGKKIITFSIILFMVLNYLLPLVNYAEFDLGSIKDVIVKGLDEPQEEIGREYEIKEIEEWDISPDGDGSVIAQWNLEDRSLHISGTGIMKNWKRDSNLNWHKKYKKIIKKIIIENGVTNIGEYAFYKCSNITNITIPESVTSIGLCAFYECSSLTNITIPESVTSIEGHTFSGCSSLARITIPNSITSINSSAFSDCNSLTSVYIPESVTKLESYIFDGCSSLTEINVSDNNTKYTSIDGVLYNKERTQLIKYPSNKKDNKYSIIDSVTSIEENALTKCNNLISINIPDTVTNIKRIDFDEKTNIICKTNSNAHKYAEDNKKLYILSDNVTSNYTTEYQIKETAEWDISENGDRSVFARWKLEDESITIFGTGKMKKWNSLSTKENWHKNYKNKIKKIIIESGVTNIGKGAFEKCSNITSVVISNSVKSIGEYAFYECSSLTNITIPNNVTGIESSAFEGCSNLTSITIPNSVTSIENHAFRKCTSLTSIYIPESVTSSERSMFDGCSNLSEINVSENNTKYTSLDGVLYNKEKTELIKYPPNKNDTEYIMPNSVTKIEYGALYDCSNLTSINISDSINKIETSSFEGCSGLTEINVSKNNEKYTSIDGILYNKEQTELIKYPPNKKETEYNIINGVTSLAYKAFYNCSNLSRITIPNSVITIGGRAFFGCISLKNIIIPESIIKIEDKAFDDEKYIICKINTPIHKYLEDNKVSYLLDEDSAIVTVKYSTKELTNQNVIVTLTTNEEIQAIYGWILSSDKKQLTKEYSNNTTETITIKDLVGNETKQTITINNIDKTGPKINVKYSTIEKTNQNVIITLTTDEEVQAISGWTLSENKKELTKTFTENMIETISLKDVLGNETKQTITINNIDKTLKISGDINENNKIDIGDILLIKRHMAYTNSTIVANKHSNWKLSDEKTTIGDINKNGKIDIGDILKLQRYISASNSKEVAQKHKDWLNL